MSKISRTGIAICGTLLVDIINETDTYPNCGELTKILAVQSAVGGCVCNVGIDLKKICPDLKVSAIGKIGADDNGEFIKSELLKNGLDTTALTVAEEKTSFTQVISQRGGQRTFFTYAGADGEFTADDLDIDNISAKILHLGYFLLLKKIDEGEGIKILKKATDSGIETSIDLVSENSDRYSLVIPCLKYTDYLIINEIEAGKLTGIEPTKNNLCEIAEKLKKMGVRKKVIIHMKNGAVCCSEQGITVSGAVDIPKSEIKGTTGAGDAFCAGALYAIYRKMNDTQILDFAASTAVMALRSADATSGLCEEKEIIEYCKNFERINLC